MSEYLFPKFLESRNEYLLLVNYWSHMWNSLPADAREGWITPWFSRLDPDLEEGNPIFSAWSPRLMRGVQVIQLAPQEQSNDELHRWIDWFGGDSRNPDAIQKLVITCVLTEFSESRIWDEIEKWIESGKIVERSSVDEAWTTAGYTPELTFAGPL